MKIERRVVVVTLKSVDGDAVLKFERLKANQQNRILANLAKAQENKEQQMVALDEYQRAIAATCFDVQGLEEAGRPVTLEMFKELDLYPETINLIINGYSQALNQDTAPEQAEKNGSIPADS